MSGSMGIRTVSLVLIAVMLVACSVAASQARRDVVQLAGQIDLRKQRGEFATWTDAVRTLDRGGRKIYDTYGVKPDYYDEAQILLRYYLAEWVDGGLLTEEQGRRELRFFDAKIEHARQLEEEERAYRRSVKTLSALSILTTVGAIRASRQPIRLQTICTGVGPSIVCH